MDLRSATSWARACASVVTSTASSTRTWGLPSGSARSRPRSSPTPAAPGRGAALLDELEDAGLEEDRRRWLRGQLEALECVTARLFGVEMGWADEVERCFGVRPTADRDERLRGGAPPAGRRAIRSGHPARPIYRLGGAERRPARDARPRARAPEGRPRPAGACARLDAARGVRQLRARVGRGVARLQLVPGRVPQPHRRQRGPPDLDRRPRRPRCTRGVPRSSHGADGEGRTSPPWARSCRDERDDHLRTGGAHLGGHRDERAGAGARERSRSRSWRMSSTAST